MRWPLRHISLFFTVSLAVFLVFCPPMAVGGSASPAKGSRATNLSKASLLKAERIRLAQEEKVVRVLRQELDLQIRELLKLKEDISGLVIQKKKLLAKIEEEKKATQGLRQKNNPTERYKKLGEYYSSMRSSKAASILQEMDPNDVVQILLSMDPDAAAAILQRMDPKKAAVVSERMRGGDGDSQQ